MSAETSRRPARPHRPAVRVKWLVLISGVFLAIQVAVTDYGSGQEDSPVALLWFVVGAVLLGLVYKKHSRFARAIVIVLSNVGALVYASNALTDSHSAVLVVAFAGQAVPLMFSPVHRHVNDRAS